MQNSIRGKRMISVRTPVVLYETSADSETLLNHRKTEDIKEILDQVNFSAIIPKQLRTYEKFKNLKYITRSALPKDLISTSSIETSPKKHSAKILKSNQHFIELRFSKLQTDSTMEISNKSNYYQEILDRISKRLIKYKKNNLIRSKKHDSNEGTEKFNLVSKSPALQKTRKRFRSVYGNKSKGFNFF